MYTFLMMERLSTGMAATLRRMNRQWKNQIGRATMNRDSPQARVLDDSEKARPSKSVFSRLWTASEIPATSVMSAANEMP